MEFGPFQSGSSIIMLGLIALAKALSPSHAALSYSLYLVYKRWREDNGLGVSKGFKGFKSNRFGRVPYIAKKFCEEKGDLIR